MASIDDSIDVESLDHEIDRDLGWTDAEKPRARRSSAYWQSMVHGLGVTSKVSRVFRALARAVSAVLFYPIFSPFSSKKVHDIDGNQTIIRRTLVWRILDGIMMRVLLTPVILGLFFITIVWLTTHPQRVQASHTPLSMDMVYRDVELEATDGQHISGWFLPPMSVDDVEFSGGRVIGQKWPGVVLCHGLGSSQDAYLPLAKSLHDAGFAVLLLDLRGQGASESAAVTFGIRERLDVLAGVKFLRETPTVDATKVCVVGQGIGAAAVLHAAALDSSIAAVVADDPCPSFDAQVKAIFDRPNVPTRWMAPFYEITFEMMLRERTGDLNLSSMGRMISHQPVLFIAYPGSDSTPVADVIALAETTAAPHQVIVQGSDNTPGTPGIDKRVTDFLTQATHWVAPRLRLQEEIRKLKASQVK